MYGLYVSCYALHGQKPDQTLLPMACSCDLRSVRRVHPLLTAALLLVTAGCSPDAVRDVPEPSPVELAIQPLAKLDDGTSAILARPNSVYPTSAGVYVISDYSDKNLKLYGTDGRRTGALGRPGRGPGEFTALTSSGVFRDTVWGFDFLARSITLFGADGKAARSLTVPGRPMDVRVVDDSLFLLASAMVPGRRNLLTLMRPDGSVVSSFFDRSEFVGGNPEMVQSTGVIADARDGRVYAGLKGGDSLFVFDYQGSQVAADLIDPQQPLVSYRALLARGNGRLRQKDGTHLDDGVPVLIEVVALDAGGAVLHVAPYSVWNGLDRVEGGRLIAVALAPGRTVRTVGKTEFGAGLMGRSRSGSPLLLGYAKGDTDRYVLSQMVLRPLGARRGGR